VRIDNIETPALILDMEIFEQNIKNMNELTKSAGIALRPHYKSHKCTAIAHMQIAAGAKGITCAKLSEAEDLIAAGIEDVLIANQIVEPSKLARVAYLAGCCRLTVCVDQIQNIHALEAAAATQGTTIHCLVEYEIGMNRCGVSTPEEFYSLAKLIDESPHLVFDGIQAYAAHLSHEEDFEKRKTASEQLERTLKDLRVYIEDKGLAVKEISGESTGTAQFRTKGSVYTELQAGSYIFMDTAYSALHLNFKNALFVLATIMSANDKLIVTDAGRKNISIDQKLPTFRDYPDLSVIVSEEHCRIPLEGHSAAVGSKLMLIPGHCCTTVNLHDFIYLVRNGKVVDRIPVTSRGKSK